MFTNNLSKKERSFYSSVHYWLKHNYGVASKCESKNCTKKSTDYQWAKKREKEYDYKRDNFINLCRSCHAKYDCTEETIKKLKALHPRNNSTHCQKGHEYTIGNTYLYKGTRNCIKCKKENQKRYKKIEKNIDAKKKYDKEYRKTIKYKEYQIEYRKEYRKTVKYTEYQKDYQKTYFKNRKHKLPQALEDLKPIITNILK